MVSRTEAGVSSQLGWDAESELVGLQSGGSGASGGSGSSFVYSADGDRVVRSDASGVTVYLPGGQEVSISASGAVSAARYYGFGGATVAVRVGVGLAGVSSLVSDAHGTPVASVPNTKRPDVTAVDRMYTDPFGAARGGSGAGTVPGDRQFLGLTRDGSGLTLLGARYYDETLGRFLSVDPLLDLADPQQWNGYAYANNNPTSMSDPSGLRVSEPSADADFHSPGYRAKQDRQKQAKAADQAAVTDAYVAARQGSPSEEIPVTVGPDVLPPLVWRDDDLTSVPPSWLYTPAENWTGCETALFNAFSADLRCIPKTEEETAEEILNTAIDLMGGIAGARSSNGKPRNPIVINEAATTASIRREMDTMMRGHDPHTRLVGTPEEVHALFQRWTTGATKVSEGFTKNGQFERYMYELGDGTQVQIRFGSDTGGPAIDVFYTGKGKGLVHVGDGS